MDRAILILSCGRFRLSVADVKRGEGGNASLASRVVVRVFYRAFAVNSLRLPLASSNNNYSDYIAYDSGLNLFLPSIPYAYG